MNRPYSNGQPHLIHMIDVTFMRPDTSAMDRDEYGDWDELHGTMIWGAHAQLSSYSVTSWDGSMLEDVDHVSQKMVLRHDELQVTPRPGDLIISIGGQSCQYVVDKTDDKAHYGSGRFMFVYYSDASPTLEPK